MDVGPKLSLLSALIILLQYPAAISASTSCFFCVLGGKKYKSSLIQRLISLVLKLKQVQRI